MRSMCQCSMDLSLSILSNWGLIWLTQPKLLMFVLKKYVLIIRTLGSYHHYYAEGVVYLRTVGITRFC